MSASVFCLRFCFLFISILPYEESSGESFFRLSYQIPENQILWAGTSVGASVGANVGASAGANVGSYAGANVGACIGAAVADGPDILYNT